MMISVIRGDDDQIEGETLQSWGWQGDPLMAIYGTARAAMDAANAFYDDQLEWWQEDDDLWLADVDDAEDEEP